MEEVYALKLGRVVNLKDKFVYVGGVTNLSTDRIDENIYNEVVVLAIKYGEIFLELVTKQIIYPVNIIKNDINMDQDGYFNTYKIPYNVSIEEIKLDKNNIQYSKLIKDYINAAGFIRLWMDNGKLYGSNYIRHSSTNRMNLLTDYNRNKILRIDNEKFIKIK